ncbi:MAG: flavodoxin family protein [Candidatus Omnitrophica bacterium]|nr:flavodoxin family protein [Candidatus Omnitrophota bacterium]
MSKKIIAIIGSYRKNGITDEAVDVILGALRQKGAETEKIHLTDKRIEFCTNCRCCTQDKAEERRGKCVFNDDMNGLLSKIDAADGIILASPINLSDATAIMKRFVERLIVYTYWPWGRMIPELRVKKRNKKAVTITSSSCYGWIGKIIMPGAANLMKRTAALTGAKVVKSLHFGRVCMAKGQKLSEKERNLAASCADVIC